MAAVEFGGIAGERSALDAGDGATDFDERVGILSGKGAAGLAGVFAESPECDEARRFFDDGAIAGGRVGEGRCEEGERDGEEGEGRHGGTVAMEMR